MTTIIIIACLAECWDKIEEDEEYAYERSPVRRTEQTGR
jgi:hypothetical protein